MRPALLQPVGICRILDKIAVVEIVIHAGVNAQIVGIVISSTGKPCCIVKVGVQSRSLIQTVYRCLILLIQHGLERTEGVLYHKSGVLHILVVHEASHQQVGEIIVGSTVPVQHKGHIVVVAHFGGDICTVLGLVSNVVFADLTGRNLLDRKSVV